MNPISLPVEPAQPDREIYDVQAIALFERFQTRAAYKARFGVDAPPFTITMRPKYWFDSSVASMPAEDEISYRIIRQRQGVWEIAMISMPAAEAARVNMPPDDTTVAAEETNSPYGSAILRPQREIPVRALLANETIIGSFGYPQIVRVDLRLKKDEAEGKFLPADRKLLQNIAQKLGLAI